MTSDVHALSPRGISNQPSPTANVQRSAASVCLMQAHAVQSQLTDKLGETNDLLQALERELAASKAVSGALRDSATGTASPSLAQAVQPQTMPASEISNTAGITSALHSRTLILPKRNKLQRLGRSLTAKVFNFHGISSKVKAPPLPTADLGHSASTGVNSINADYSYAFTRIEALSNEAHGALPVRMRSRRMTHTGESLLDEDTMVAAGSIRQAAVSLPGNRADDDTELAMLPDGTGDGNRFANGHGPPSCMITSIDEDAIFTPTSPAQALRPLPTPPYPKPTTSASQAPTLYKSESAYMRPRAPSTPGVASSDLGARIGQQACINPMLSPGHANASAVRAPSFRHSIQDVPAANRGAAGRTIGHISSSGIGSGGFDSPVHDARLRSVSVSGTLSSRPKSLLNVLQPIVPRSTFFTTSGVPQTGNRAGSVPGLHSPFSGSASGASITTGLSPLSSARKLTRQDNIGTSMSHRHLTQRPSGMSDMSNGGEAGDEPLRLCGEGNGQGGRPQVMHSCTYTGPARMVSEVHVPMMAAARALSASAPYATTLVPARLPVPSYVIPEDEEAGIAGAQDVEGVMGLSTAERVGSTKATDRGSGLASKLLSRARKLFGKKSTRN